MHAVDPSTGSPGRRPPLPFVPPPSSRAGRRVGYVAAADLAHVGPALGDPAPMGADERELLKSADSELMRHVAAGDAGGFLDDLRAERDRRRICGLPPIYLMLRT